MLPEISPQHLAAILGVERLPPADFSIVTASNKNGASDTEFDMHKFVLYSRLVLKSIMGVISEWAFWTCSSA
jgi:hypothetical protein